MLHLAGAKWLSGPQSKISGCSWGSWKRTWLKAEAGVRGQPCYPIAWMSLDRPRRLYSCALPPVLGTPRYFALFDRKPLCPCQMPTIMLF